jgi:hypothetical protein
LAIVDLLETWRDWSLGKIAADETLRPAHQTLFRLFWSAFSMSATLLQTLIDVRLGRTSASRISNEIPPAEITLLGANATESQEMEILERLSQKRPSQIWMTAEVPKSQAYAGDILAAKASYSSRPPQYVARFTRTLRKLWATRSWSVYTKSSRAGMRTRRSTDF